MNIETHRLENEKNEQCEFCFREAKFYSQAVADGKAALSRIVLHCGCRECRKDARIRAEELVYK